MVLLWMVSRWVCFIDLDEYDWVGCDNWIWWDRVEWWSVMDCCSILLCGYIEYGYGIVGYLYGWDCD